MKAANAIEWEIGVSEHLTKSTAIKIVSIRSVKQCQSVCERFDAFDDSFDNNVDDSFNDGFGDSFDNDVDSGKVFY